MCNLDVFGFGNTLKIIVVPLIILFKMRNTVLLIHKGKRENTDAIDTEKFLSLSKNPSNRLSLLAKITWSLILCYSLLSLSWTQSGDIVAGLKYVVNGLGLILTYYTFKKANELKLFNSKTVTFMVLSTLTLGIIQTYVIDSAFGVFYSRFTGFLASQTYAAFLVGLLTIVLWNKQLSSLAKLLLSLSLITAIIANGSRTWFLGSIVVVSLCFIVTSRKSMLKMSMLFFVATLIMISFLSFYSYAINNEEKLMNTNRLFEGFYTLIGQNTSSGGTIDAREIMNAGMIYEIKHSSVAEKFIGHGVSSAANVSKMYSPNTYSYHYGGSGVDKNRVAHNEWLRILYEYGISGIIMWLLFIAYTLAYLIKFSNSLALLSYSLAVLISSFTENIVMSAGSIGLCGLLILVAIRTPKEIIKEEKFDFQIPTRYLHNNSEAQ